MSVFKKFGKIGDNWKNSVETHRRRWRNSENQKHRNAAGLTDKSAGFFENRRVSFGRFLSETGQFLPKFGKWNEKPVKNNDMTSTKFVHINSP
jgi:hypothetical protein